MLFSFTVSLCVYVYEYVVKAWLMTQKKDEYNFCIAIVNTKNIYTHIRIRKDNSFQKTGNNNKRRKVKKHNKNKNKRQKINNMSKN